MDCGRGKPSRNADIASELQNESRSAGALRLARGSSADIARELQNEEAVIRMPGQRDPDLTRRVILEAATTEFANKGYAGASVNVIAAAANVNKRMLYHYFGKKDDLYLVVLERAYAHLRTAQTRLKLSELAPREAIGSFVMFTWNYFMEHPELLRLFTSESLMQARYLRRSTRIRESSRPLIAMLDGVLRRGAAEGVFRASVDALHLYISMASLTSFFLSGRHTLSAIYGEDLGGEAGLDMRARHIVDVIIGYLRP